MKILHTSDWHIGKKLNREPFEQDMHLYFEFLMDCIQEKQIDVLLISGDIFDFSNPSAGDRKVYYEFLSKLLPLPITVIITGGNHDGVNVLNAPQEILSALNMFVIGGATENIEDELIELKNKKGEIVCMIAAVPYLREHDLYHRSFDEGYKKSRIQAIKDGIHAHYRELFNRYKTNYENEIPIIAMGHLYAVGINASESERDIYVGNQGAIGEEVFEGYDYVALGHIHKPQRIGNNQWIRYSGSPIAFSFSEQHDKKQMILLTIQDNQLLIPEKIQIPKHRALLRIEGNINTIRDQLACYENNYLLPAYIELNIEVEMVNDVIMQDIEQLKEEYRNDTRFKIISHKITAAQQLSTLELEQINRVEDCTPVELFEQLLVQKGTNDELQNDLKDLFLSLVEEIESEQ